MTGNAVRWAIRNTPAMNMIVIGVLVVGSLCAYLLRREVFPQFELEIILVAVPYPGASPDEVESGICQKVEEAVRSVDGIKKVTSVAAEGMGNVVIEVRSDVPDVQRVLNEVKSQIDRIPSFPDLAEEPEVQQVTFRTKAITVGIIQENSDAQNAELQLREITVVKSGEKREPFDRSKIEQSVSLACRKRPVSPERIERLVSGIQRQLETLGDAEVESRQIGEMVMEGLRQLDSVAYIRFASVYRDFTEARDFEEFASSVREVGHK